ncbi:LysR family transcriptional regulator [Ruegeria arenilitoris]|uniref:LysR family transcriptional regulator n=1 Tax=Ruegeria arenilitoris TaxID=1173585 RepID=UPI00147AA9A1|nr:LysR family transcriptional regulator [Ruegeria arenilitoris]
MRLPFATLEIFDAIVREGSFKGAATRLGLQPSTVSHQLKALEEQMGTALIIRTTRSLSLTEAGRALMRGVGPAFEQVSYAVESARSVGHEARGTLKVAMPEFVFKLCVGPKLQSFREAYPEIELEMSFTDAFSDILEEELHAGFRLGDRIAEDMVAIRLTPPLKLAVMASPNYLERRGVPDHPSDLLEHNCIRYRFQSSRQISTWYFTEGDKDYSVAVNGPLIVNTLPASVNLAMQHHGFIWTFRDYCEEEVQRGDLISVLEDHLGQTPGIYIYFPREYRKLMPLRLFFEHLSEP